MSRKKRIIFINDYVHGGGVEKVLENIVGYLDPDKYDITVMTHMKEKNFYKYYPAHVRYINYGHIAHASFFRRVVGIPEYILRGLYNRRYLKEHYDAVVAIKEGQSMIEALKFKYANRRIGWVHIDFAIAHWTKCCFANIEKEYKCMEAFDKIVCVSQTVKDGVVSEVGDTKNLVVKYNPLKEREILKLANEKFTDMNRGAVTFVTVGRLIAQKSYDRLLNVCKRLNDNGLDYKLYIIGGGQLQSALLKQKEKLGLDNVVFFGQKSNPYPYIKGADWFVCSSLYEGFSTVLQESAVLSTPIITTECAGARELLGDSEYGIITENSEEALYEGMKKILEDKTVTEHYGEKIKEIQNSISLEKRMRDIEALF